MQNQNIATGLKKSLKVIFYYQPTGRYALNIIAGALGSHSSTKNIPIEFCRNSEDLVQKIADSEPNFAQLLICWSFYSPDFLSVKMDLEKVKRAHPKSQSIHIAGGVHASAEPHQTLQAGFDLIAIGEGEQTIIELCNALQQDTDFTNLQGLGLYIDGKMIRNSRGKSILLDDFPPGAPTLGRFGPIEITRGCVYACKFCQTPFMHKAKFRHRSVESVGHYIKMMLHRGYKDFRFITPTSLSYGSANEDMNLEAVTHLLSTVRKLIGKQRRIFFGSFPSEVRPEHVNPESLQVLKKYIDNDNIIIGGQSGSDAILEKCGRGHDVQSIIRAVKLAKAFGFKPNVDLLFGLPGENQTDVNATLNLATMLTDLGARIHTHVFMPLPGTPYRNEPAGTMSTETKISVESLSSKGKAYGQWKSHLQFAADLQRLRQK